MNLPNKITLFRICMIPVFLFFYLYPPFGARAGGLAALLVFAIASASDALDGHIARSRNLITNFGKLMDPLADKLLVAAALIAMVQGQVLPAWVVIVLISREFFITGFRQLLLAQDHTKVIAASFWAKVKTAVQMVMILLLLANLSVWLPGIAQGIRVAEAVLIYASVILSVLSAAEYVYKNPIK